MVWKKARRPVGKLFQTCMQEGLVCVCVESRYCYGGGEKLLNCGSLSKAEPMQFAANGQKEIKDDSNIFSLSNQNVTVLQKYNVPHR